MAVTPSKKERKKRNREFGHFSHSHHEERVSKFHHCSAMCLVSNKLRAGQLQGILQAAKIRATKKLFSSELNKNSFISWA